MGPEESSAGVVQSWPHHLIDELLLQLPVAFCCHPNSLFFSGSSSLVGGESESKKASRNERQPTTVGTHVTAWKYGTGLSAKPATMNSAMSGWALSDHAERIGPTGPMCGNPRDPLEKRLLLSGFALHEVNDGSRLPDGNSQNLQPLLWNWKQRVTSPHHSVWFHRPGSPGQCSNPNWFQPTLCSTLASSRDATGCARGTRALHRQPHASATRAGLHTV